MLPPAVIQFPFGVWLRSEVVKAGAGVCLTAVPVPTAGAPLALPPSMATPTARTTRTSSTRPRCIPPPALRFVLGAPTTAAGDEKNVDTALGPFGNRRARRTPAGALRSAARPGGARSAPNTAGTLAVTDGRAPPTSSAVGRRRRGARGRVRRLRVAGGRARRPARGRPRRRLGGAERGPPRHPCGPRLVAAHVERRAAPAGMVVPLPR